MSRFPGLRKFALLVFSAVTVSPVFAQLATVSVNVTSLGKTIPTDFSGIGLEVDDAATASLGPASNPNLVYYQLIKNLGHGVIRIGGASTDYSCWNPVGAPNPRACTFTITQDELNGYMSASATLGWPILLGVNLQQNGPAWAVQYGVAAVQANAAFPGS